MVKVTTDDIENAIIGVYFPARKNEIIKQVDQNKADEEVKKAIEKIPEKIYNSPAEVSSQTLNMKNVI